MGNDKKEAWNSDYKLDRRLTALSKLVFSRDGTLHTNERNSPQRNAWVEWRRFHGLPWQFHERADRATFVSEYPPADLVALTAMEAEYAGGGDGFTRDTYRALKDGI